MQENKKLTNYTQSEIEHFLKEWVIGLHASRNRRIIRDKLFRGMSIREIAHKYKLSDTRVKTVIRTFRRKIEG